MLDSHPKMGMAYESYVLTDVNPAKTTFISDGQFDVHRMIRSWQDHRFFGSPVRMSTTSQRLLQCFPERLPVDSVEKLVRSLYENHAAIREGSRFGEKVTSPNPALPFLAETMPETRFIHIIRDGRDVANAMTEVRWAPDSLMVNAHRWNRRVAWLRRFGSSLPAARYLEIRYEELVADPPTVLKGICEAIELDYESGMARPHENAVKAFPGLKVVTPDMPSRLQPQKRLLLPPTEGVRDWRSDLNPLQAAIAETLAAPSLEESGYRLTRTRSGLRHNAFRKVVAFSDRLSLFYRAKTS